MIGPLLKDIRILEIGHFIAGPFAARALADLGADVIKVEPPGTGDPIRAWGKMVDGKSLWWSMHGRNKRCVTLNTRHPKALEMLLELVSKCDCVIENQKVGQLDKWGLTAEAMNKVRPGITIVRITGFGQTGPEAPRAGWGVIGEAKGGLRHLCAYPEGVTDLPPVRCGVSIGDSIAGLYGALGAVSAILEQKTSGRTDPRVIDVALGESVLSFMESIVPEYGYTGAVRAPAGSSLPTAAPSSAYKTADGAWVLIAANSEAIFRSLLKVMNMPELGSDPRFVGNPERVANREALDRLIANWAVAQKSDALIEKLEAADIPTTKIYSIADVAADKQYQARDMLPAVADPLFSKPIMQTGVVPVVEGLDRNAQIRWAGPAVGQHNSDVYTGLLGKSATDIAEMKKAGLI
ncbi:MAG TPA: CaiB/BaiF CoA-transferase family protein [Hyphomicrobiaceae bacterium]|nr:CaiB/BaiF CoA-transferase family protein [Hyphomicrobiaceae bacterium]